MDSSPLLSSHSKRTRTVSYGNLLPEVKVIGSRIYRTRIYVILLYNIIMKLHVSSFLRALAVPVAYRSFWNSAIKRGLQNVRIHLKLLL